MTSQQRRSREGMRGSYPSDRTSARKHGAMVPARGDSSKTYDRDKQFKKNIGPQGSQAGHEAERDVKKVRGAKEETEMSALIAATLDELSKATLGSYVKKAAHDTAGAGIDLGVSSQKKGGQTRGDVDKHAGKLVKRQKGIGKAVDKLSKEDMSLAPKGKGRKAAKRMYGEDISIVDAVQEVLGLGNKWSGMEKMPPVDPKTGKMVTGKSKIIRITDKGKKALKKGDHKLSITAKGRAAVEEVEMDEKNWIKGAIKKPGALRKSLDVPAGENIPARKLASAAKEGGKMGQRARLAQTLKKMHNDYVPENGNHPPKGRHKEPDKPESGKIYALTGRSDQPSIARGDSWKKSVVTKKRKEQDAKK